MNLIFILCTLLLSSSFEVKVSDEHISEYKDDQGILIQGKWRAGDMMRYQFLEHIRTSDDSGLIDERIQSTFVLVEVAARRGNEGFILLWRVLQSDAPLFNDDTLDEHIYGLLADGVVIHTDVFGAYSHTSNMDYLWDQFRNAVDILDQRNHWQHKQEDREYIQYYMDYKDAFEALLIRDMMFLFGMHGVVADIHEVYYYETWQLNPWGEPINSTGRLETLSFNRDSGVIEFLNSVKGYISNPLQAELSEIQHFTIHLFSGWPINAKLTDKISTDDFTRLREVEIKQIIY